MIEEFYMLELCSHECIKIIPTSERD
jgi:hypothetical protein